MSNTINTIDADGNVSVVQVNSVFAQLIRDKPSSTLKLTHETNTIPPPLPIKLSKRKLLVDDFILKLDATVSLHVQGEVGTGKTQLCNLLIRNRTENIYWFRLREYREQFKILISELNASIIGKQSLNPLKLFSKKLYIAPLSIIVLDDLPDLESSNALEDFIQLVMTCDKYNVKIISSSNFTFPSRMNQYSRFVQSVHIPEFNEKETVELLNSYEAPIEIQKFAKLINLFSDSHPSLVIATINYLESNDWKIDFDNFFKNKFLDNELQYFQNFLDKTVENKEAKELVYRLNNIGRTVTDEDIRLVSSIEPKIEHPFEKLGMLLNRWIFKESDNEYLLSPLIYKLGSRNLDLEVERNLNMALADSMFKKVTMNPYEISRGINYYVKAKDYNTAGFRLFGSLYSAIGINDLIEDNMFYLHSYWVGTSLPEEMETSIQLLLRTVQIIIYNKFGKDVEKLYENYLTLELKVKTNNEVNPYTLVLSYMMFSQNKYRTFEYGLKLIDKLNEYTLAEREKIWTSSELENIPVEAVFLLNFDKLNTIDDFTKWILAIKKTEVEKLQQLFSSDLGEEGIQALKYKINEKLIKKYEILKVRELYILLLDLADYMYANMIINVWSSLITSAINCLIRDEKLNKADELVEKSLLKTDNTDYKLMINHYLAIKYVDKEDYDRALYLYKEVIDIDKTIYLETLVDALTYASIAFAKIDEYDEAKVYMEKALRIYKSVEKYDEPLLASLYGEYSIILWHLDLKHECLVVCEQILMLIEKNDDVIDEYWKVKEIVLGHCLGYYVSVLEHGKPPEELEDGEAYACPMNRFYIYTGTDTATLYDKGKRFVLYYQLYNSFYQLNDRDRGLLYLHKSFEMSKESKLEDFKILLYKDIYLVENNFAGYFDILKLLSKSSESEGIALFIQLSLLKLTTLIEHSPKSIEEYKFAFIKVFSEILEKKYFDVILYTLSKLNGEEAKIELESGWLIQRIYFISEIYSHSIIKALEVHRVFFNDFFETGQLKHRNIIKVEVLEIYFFRFWISKINMQQKSFSYSDSLLKRINEVFEKKIDSNDKVLELLNLVDRYKKY